MKKQILVREFMEEIGQLLCDKMHLKQDILINVKSDKMDGFTENFISKKKILKNLLNDDVLEYLCKPATQV